ncbi:hypothetical protein ACQ4PT_026382 [Festuca glaucescens]
MGSKGSTLPSKELHCESWPSIVSAPASSVTTSDVVLQSTLAAQSELLQRVRSFLEMAEAALSKLSLVPTMLKTIPITCLPGEADVGSAEDKGPELYGCFSPRVNDSPLSLPLVPSIAEGEAISVVMASVLQTMPELQELCGSPSLPLSKVVLPATSCVIPNSPMLGEKLEVNSPEHSDVASVTIPPPPTHNSDVLFTKELCDLLSSVEIAIPGCGRAIAFLLTGTSTKGKSKKVGDCPQTTIRKEKSIRCKDKKFDATRKASVAA